MNQSNKYMYNFLKSDKVEGFFFSMLCATIFTAGFCHSMLDLAYKYLESQAGKAFYVDFNWGFWICVIILLFYTIRDCVVYKEGAKFDFAFIMLTQAMLFTGIIAYHNQNYSTIPYTWIIPSSYLIGKAVGGSNREKANERIIIVMYTLMLALFLISMLDFYNFFKYSKLSGYYLTEIWPGFFTNEEQNRCGMSLGLFLVNTSLGFAIYRRKKEPILAFFITIAFVVSQYWALKVESRTITLLPVLSLGIILILILCEKRGYISRRGWIGIVIFVLLSALAIMVMIKYDIFHMGAYLIGDEYGGSILKNVRFTMDKNAFKLLLQNPLGRTEFPEDTMFRPHNTFLQYGESYGIVVFALIEIFRLATLKDAVVMSLKINANSSIKYLLVPAFLCLNVNYSMDPNGFIQRHLWMLVIFISGLIRGWVDLSNQNTQAWKKNQYE